MSEIGLSILGIGVGLAPLIQQYFYNKNEIKRDFLNLKLLIDEENNLKLENNSNYIFQIDLVKLIENEMAAYFNLATPQITSNKYGKTSFPKSVVDLPVKFTEGCNPDGQVITLKGFCFESLVGKTLFEKRKEVRVTFKFRKGKSFCIGREIISDMIISNFRNWLNSYNFCKKINSLVKK